MTNANSPVPAPWPDCASWNSATSSPRPSARGCRRLGADVVKVELPGVGDPVRQWGARYQGQSAWWSVHGRNKRCVTLDLKKPRARELALRLAARSDALVENFRPGQLDELGPAARRRCAPRTPAW